MTTTITTARFPRSAATARLRRFLSDAIHRIADAPLHSPVVTALRPTARAATLPHGNCQRAVVTVYLTCDGRQERRVRALLSDALTTSGLRYEGINAQRIGDTVEFEAAVTVHGAPSRAVKPLLSRLFLQPGVHDVRWTAVDARPPSPRGPHAVAA
ncbi:hypothetical protein ACFOSC_19490 [Streptantibioticus rubrisoli]|uniref:MgtC-like C-terminal domain-containing protein n=1 Tax=Streptantibioticus rubrisoli TaxID=1387313 RepID=A0ABT1PLZ6_9ACTN|nr:hypothetical protein [Streptantibioticus rubrisoli]MCQ4046374.1 hypothetical protein [Streptantibioticus rubrisoli]